MMRPATNRQLALIKSLQSGNGEINEDLNSSEASKQISELIHQEKNIKGQAKINEPLLWMALKECFKLWTAMNWDIWNDKRCAFIKETIATYYLFTEVTDTLNQTLVGKKIESDDADTAVYAHEDRTIESI